MVYQKAPIPGAAEGQVLVRVKAAGVGPWDVLVREGKSAVHQSLPLILGADLAGVVETVGDGVSGFHPGDEVFGVTNSQFTGAYAEYAVAEAGMIARKPKRLGFVEAASVPVAASTAWRMVFDYGRMDDKTRVLILGGAGNVGAYAVQLAKLSGAEVITTTFTRDVDYARSLDADQVIDTQKVLFERRVKDVDVVIDTIGGETLDRSFNVLKRGGMLLSSVATPDQDKAAQHNVLGVFFIISVTSGRLIKIADMLDSGQLKTNVGEVLNLSEAVQAHEMLAGMPHKRGKIVLAV